MRKKRNEKKTQTNDEKHWHITFGLTNDCSNETEVEMKSVVVVQN